MFVKIKKSAYLCNVQLRKAHQINLSLTIKILELWQQKQQKTA